MENTSMPIIQGFLGAAAGFAGGGETDTGVGGDAPIGGRGGFGTDIGGNDFDSGDFGYGGNYIYSPEGWS
jgi:hypothetical protein